MKYMRVLMVCLGNICRSPVAQGILDQKCNQLKLDWIVDSAGTSGWHNGDLPDPRSINTASANGIDITNQRSRLFVKEDFQNFDLILAMDSSNYQNILKLAVSEDDKQKVKLILNYVFPGENRAVPDPYYNDGFDHVFGLLDAACDRLVKEYQ